MRLNHAILHVLDFNSCVNVFSQVELDIAEKQTKAFVSKHARRALASGENKRGTFEPDSLFAPEIRAYFHGQRDFVDISIQIAEFLAGELNAMEKAESTDILVIDFEDDVKLSAADIPEDEFDAAIDAAYDQDGKRYFAILLMESRQAFMHEVGREAGGAICNSIERHHAILPSPSQKIQSYALIESKTLNVKFVDKPREIAGQETWLIPEGLLQCTKEASSKEIMDTVTRVVEEVAQEYGANTTMAVSKAKAYVSQSVEESENISVEELSQEVFNDEPMQERFCNAVAEENLPERVNVEKKVAQRVSRNQKIRTDTGIEITFPSEYCENPDFIEFFSTPNGLISIELKNIGSIENK